MRPKVTAHCDSRLCFLFYGSWRRGGIRKSWNFDEFDEFDDPKYFVQRPTKVL
jgi:hypothetical protein